MRRICARCGVPLDGAGPDKGDQPISHGLCPECARNLLFQAGVPLADFLESLAGPVIAVDTDGRVLGTNTQLAGLLGKPPEAMKDHLAGLVFECEYAGLPGGCGRNVHCSGCTIRNKVTETQQSGRSFSRVPAVLYRDFGRGLAQAHLIISTERLGEAVLVRIDDFRPEAAPPPE